MSHEKVPRNGSEIVFELVSAAADSLAQAIPPAVTRGWQRLVEIAEDPQLRSAIAHGIQAAAEFIEDELERYEADPYSFLYDEMLAGTAIVLIAKRRIGDDTILFDAVEDSLLEGPLLSEVVEAVAGAPYLSDAQRERISLGFQYLEKRRWIPACDFLLKGFEGALWDTAHARGVIDEKRYLTAPARPRLVKGPHGLVADDRFGPLRPSFERFIGKAVFSSEGHDLRHGRYGHSERRYAHLSAVAIFGWLDHYAETNLMEGLGRGVDSYIEAQAEIEAADRRGLGAST